MRSSVIYIIKLYRAATTTAALQSFRLDFRFIHHLYIYLHVQFLTSIYLQNQENTSVLDN